MKIFWRCLRGIICAPLLFVVFLPFVFFWVIRYDWLMEKTCQLGFVLCDFVGSGAPIFYEQGTQRQHQRFLNLGFVCFVFITTDLKRNNWFIGCVSKKGNDFKGVWF